ncbi:MAG: SPOR domain-containing protein [Melioribacteraceae bacterium]|nr:SPOR domain-containing protein [Melioribacteraceae bacterium]
MRVSIFALLVVFTGCSVFQSSDKSTDESVSEDQAEEVYVFDEIPAETDGVKEEEIRQLEEELEKSTQNEKKEEVDVFGEPVEETTPPQQQQVAGAVSYYLQLGAFSSLKRAEDYSKEIESQVPFKLSIIYNSQTSFYNVRSRAYSTREEVELLRDDFWSKNLFKDAFIVTE